MAPLAWKNASDRRTITPSAPNSIPAPTVAALASGRESIVVWPDEPDSDTIRVALDPVRLRKKRPFVDSVQDDEDVSHNRQRKRARVKHKNEAQPSKSKSNAIRSDSPADTIQVRLACRADTRQSSQPHSSPQDGTGRLPFQELSSEQFQNRMRRPIAWFHRPQYSKKFIAQFSRVDNVVPLRTTAGKLQDHSTLRSEEDAIEELAAEGERESARTSRYIGLLSDDEIAREFEVSTKPERPNDRHIASNKTRKPAKVDDSESEFEAFSDDVSSVAESDASDLALEDDGLALFEEASEEEGEEGEEEEEEGEEEEEEEEEMPIPRAKKSKVKNAKGATKLPKNMKNILTRTKGQPGIHYHLRPMSNTKDMFGDITKNALGLGLDKALKHLNGAAIRVATLCSGTESPLLALEMICSSLKAMNEQSLRIEHLFSAEIVPFKQAYIERNFSPSIIFRDITELTSAVNDKIPMATTAYGGKSQVPTDVDVVIAGTSCVDFSMKNKHRKGIRDGGESGDTFSAVVAYCNAFRPAMVLLENVRGAEWEVMFNDYEGIGYEVGGVLVDTKDYYLPQTRQRGYMVCFEKQKLRTTSAGVAGVWINYMKRLKRPASSPATHFTLPNDDVPRQQALRDDEPLRKVKWAQCAIRAMKYRQEHGIGIERPITNWSESGTVLPPDFCQADWFRGREERVLDYLDVAYMRKTLPDHGMYDPRYKARFLEVSQNVDRDQDTKQFGIVGCITPSGRMIISDTGREVAAEELLMLQGLPLDRISFTTETSVNIRDLAGNAMSTTIIGCAVLSAIIAGYGSIKRRDAFPPFPDSGSHPTQPAASPLSKTGRIRIKPDSATSDINISTLLEAAEQASRKCYCEGMNGMAAHTIQTCTECGHTACIECGGNPRHHYRQDPISKNLRISAVQFEELVRDCLPLRLKFSGYNKSNQLSKSQYVPYRGSLDAALSQSFAFQRVRRTHCWTIEYSTTRGDSTLALVLDAGKAEWRLYAHAPKCTPLEHPLRKTLQSPVAISSLTSSLFAGWKVRSPQVHAAPATFLGTGTHIASMWSRRGMTDFAQHRLWEFLTVQGEVGSVVSGKYKYLPHCGTANECLYKRVEPSGDEPLYLFLDPTRLGSPDEDCFVFSHSIAKLEPDEIRPIIAQVERPWLAWSADVSPIIPAKTRAKLLLDSQWINLDVRLRPEAPQHVIHLPKRLDQQNCREPVVLVECSVPQDISPIERALAAGSIEEDLINRQKWVFETARPSLRGRNWTNWTDLHIEACRCLTCAPPRPALRWKLRETGTLEAYEYPPSASDYEKAVKSRPNAFYIHPERCSGNLKLELVANLHTLAHRAGARLPGQIRDIRYQWRLVSTTLQKFVFRPFQLKPTTDVKPFNKILDLTVNLFPKQRLALAWMREQEKGIDVEIEEAEEAEERRIRWRIEVVAQTYINIRGGICADHPGFGKTITSLALISSELKELGKAAIEAELSVNQTATGLIPTAATLIVCPSSLVKQWLSEIREKLHWSDGILCVRSVADLGRHTIEDFQSAKIILLNRAVLGNNGYVERLAAFAAIPGPATSKGRAFKEWLKSALKEIPAHVRMLQQDGGNRLREHVKQSYRCHLSSDRFKSFEPSRRLKGANYVASKAKNEATHKSEVIAAELDTKNLLRPLFEQFLWNRIIVDEFHEYSLLEYEIIANLQANKRWGLSGTPAINDFYEVAEVARLLQVPLPRGNVSSGVMLKRSVRRFKDECTDAEEFEEMRQVQSESMHARMYDLHQCFLDKCVRRNIMDFAEMQYKESLLPVRLDCDHRAFHMELMYHLSSSDMRIKKMMNTADRFQRINELFNSCSSAEEALSRHAATLDITGSEAIHRRERQLHAARCRLSSLLSDAKKYESASFDQWKDSQLRIGALGDQEVVDEIKAALSGTQTLDEPNAEASNATDYESVNQDSEDDSNSKRKNKYSKAKAKTKTSTAPGKNARTAALQDLCDQLVVAKRSLRYFQSLKVLSKSLEGKQRRQGSVCDADKCPGGYSEAAAAVSCGHLICRTCFDAMESSSNNKCPADGCRGKISNEHLLWAHTLGSPREEEGYGAKLEAATKLLHRIEKQGDQAILFVQSPDQLDKVEVALNNHGISSIVVKRMAHAGGQFEEFRDNAGKRDHKTVIVLNSSDETAAGSNLQNANHVIFLSPLLRDTQYGYESTMAQAIGRVRRHGQKKTIHVYRILALDTIDVDLLEHRERRTDALVEDGAKEIRPPLAIKAMGMGGEAKPERTQLVHENGKFSLRPQSWLLHRGGDDDGIFHKMSKGRVLGWEDFSSSVKFSRTFTDDD